MNTVNFWQVRDAARTFAGKTVEAQKTDFQSWGIMADWEEPYLTMNADYVKREMRVFHELYKKGLLIQRYMPVYWSPVSHTALAEAELEYVEDHKERMMFSWEIDERERFIDIEF